MAAEQTRRSMKANSAGVGKRNGDVEERTRHLEIRKRVFRASSIVKKAADKDVASGRVFQVELRSKPYYPAFFLSNIIDRRMLARVVRRLRDTVGWSKWDSFTPPIESLGGSMPLGLL